MQAWRGDTRYRCLGRWVVSTAAVGGIVGGALVPVLLAAEGRTVNDGVFSDAQAKRGPCRKTFRTH